jgi:hypothetical protein
MMVLIDGIYANINLILSHGWEVVVMMMVMMVCFLVAHFSCGTEGAFLESLKVSEKPS